MKYIRLLLFAVLLVPGMAFSATGDFSVAAQLLSAARNGDISQVQNLINSGADINYVDSTGLSLVCTALMNNDMKTAQILQMYGADASQCDRQIKRYNSKGGSSGNGGLFSGLSSVHSLTLAAAGAAVVVGGLFLLTDAFDPGNGNSNSASNADRPNNGTSNNTTGTVGKVAFTLPYGPAMTTASEESKRYDTELNYYGPASLSTNIQNSFTLMTNVYNQNYLLMMHGYSPLARGYLGMRTLRNLYSGEPINLEGYNITTADGPEQVMGGRPTNVALVTENGVNAATGTSLADMFLVWTSLNNNTPLNASSSMVSSKYYNNAIIKDSSSGSDSIVGYTTSEDNTFLSLFDLSGFGTAINNPQASWLENLLAKIVVGRAESSTAGDFIGFMPNGQLTVFRTGNGIGMTSLATPVESGSAIMLGDTLSTGDVLQLFGTNLVVVKTDSTINAFEASTIALSGTVAVNDTYTLNGKTLTVIDVNGNQVLATNKVTNDAGNVVTTTYQGYINGSTLYVFEKDTTDYYTGYVSADGNVYISQTVNGTVSQAYQITNDDKLMLVKELVTGSDTIDFLNYKALLNAAGLWVAQDIADGRSRPDIIANAAVIDSLHAKGADTVDDILFVGSDNYATEIISLINTYYDRNDTDGLGGNNSKPGADAYTLFNELGTTITPLVIFSTGSVETDSHYSGRTYTATFENAAPLAFTNMNHLFMSIVPVGLYNGTDGANTIAGFSPGSQYMLSQWPDANNSTDDTENNKYYKGRVCGVAGTGLGTVDPWCFAAAGVTDELAVAAAAGAAGVVKSAFSYLQGFDNKQLFTLLALTADGPYLATATGGGAFTQDSLTGYLKSLFILPEDYDVRWKQMGEDYLDVFKEVFGYGLINLERATKPGTSIYYYDGNRIVSASGNAYWRAASNTMFRASSVLSPRVSTISAPFYDVLESIDGSMSLPRVWENSFSVGTDVNRRSLYIGDVLGDLRVNLEYDDKIQFGKLGFSVSRSEKMYLDNMNGLDKLMLDYSGNDWYLAAGYQRYLTDGMSRFSGLANPVLGLMSNAVTSDAEYKLGRWAFGGRIFSGEITDEGLLENDPAVSAQFNPARLGLMQGGQSHVAWHGDKLSLVTSVGTALETGTLLGAQTGGLLDIGIGKTTYIDTLMRYKPTDNMSVMLRSTVARTSTNANGSFVLGLSDIYSDALALGLDYGKFGFSVARPLAVTRGAIQYAYADYDVVEVSSGKYDLVVRDTHVADIDLSPEKRELRFMGSYRHSFDDFTNGAFGFVYRINPNNTDKFGNETILMLKLSHILRI